MTAAQEFTAPPCASSRANDVLGRCKNCGADDESACMCGVVVRAYSEDGSAEVARLRNVGVAHVTFAQWMKAGGCGLSHLAEFGVSCALARPPAYWRDFPLCELAAASPLAGRELARYAEDNAARFTHLFSGEPRT